MSEAMICNKMIFFESYIFKAFCSFTVVPSTGITGTGIQVPAVTPGVGVLTDGTGHIVPDGTGLPVKPGTYNI